MSGFPTIAIVTANAVDGGTETTIALHQSALGADVFVAGGLERPDACPFTYRYIEAEDEQAASDELASALRAYDVLMYHAVSEWAVHAIRSARKPAIEVVNGTATAGSDKGVATLVVTPSPFVAEHLARRHGRDALVIPHGVDVPRLPSGPSAGFVGAVSTYETRAGTDVLLRALPQVQERVPDVTVRMYCSGAAFAEYRALVAELALRDVELLRTATAPQDHVAEFRLFALPTRAESLPPVVLDALACNVPVIVSALPWSVEFNRLARERDVEPPLILVRPDDIDDLAVTLIELLQHPPARRTRAYVEEHYSLAAHLDAYRIAIGRALEGFERERAHSAVVARLEQQVAETERRISEARRSEAHQERRAGALEEQLGQVAEQHARLTEQHGRLEGQHEELRAERTRGDATVRELRTQLELRSAQVERLETQASAQAEGIEWLQQEVALREDELAAIHSSRLWRLGSRYWRARGTVGRLSAALRGRIQPGVMQVARRVLPSRVKRELKRWWDPNTSLSPVESAALLATGGGRAEDSPSDVPRPTTYDVICFSIIDWDFRWQRPQQVMSQFAAHGHRVFFLSTSQFLRPGRKPYELRALAHNVWELKLASPAHIDVYGGAVGDAVVDALVASLRQLRDDLDIATAVSVVQIATWSPAALAARDAFGWRLVYDCMDEWKTFPGIRVALLEEERRLVKESDLVVVTGQRLMDKWESEADSIVLARNAADFAHFAVPEAESAAARPGAAALLHNPGGRPVVGYFGAIAEWFDVELVARLAQQRADYLIVLLGGVFNVADAALKALPNVLLLGQKPYELMPLYLREFDVCLIPFRENAITAATDPVKFYEYIAQGKPVVSTRMPELAQFDALLYLAESPDDFVRKVDLAVAENDPGLVRRRVEVAAANTWQDRFAVIDEAIAGVHPAVAIVVVTYNNLEYTRLCLDSVLANSVYPFHHIVVVDNASSDGTSAYLTDLAARHENVDVILNDENRGFAAANNQGIEATDAEYVALLNNDTVVPPGWLPPLLRHLEQPDVGLVVSVTNFSGNESRIDVPYTTLPEMEEFAREYTRAHEGEVFDIRVAAMYCVALRREVYAEVGPLDERFSVGMFEDDDYSHRVRLAGYRVVCAEDVFVHHFGQASFKKLSAAEYQAVWNRNQRLYEEKWGTTWERHQLRSQA